jgi:hypothetical protein
MCQVDRRGFLARGGAIAAGALGAAAGARRAGAQPAPLDGFTYRDVASGVHFAEGDAIGKGYDPFAAQVAKVYEEITGRKLDLGPQADHRARERHARAHGHTRVFPLDKAAATA